MARRTSLTEYLNQCASGELDEMDTAPSPRRSRIVEAEPIYQGPQPDPTDVGKCEICGEDYDQNDPRPSVADVGEFYDPKFDGDIIAHAQCGINAGLEPA